jgi:hypothetical protein
MANRFINIDNSFITNGVGSEGSPWNWIQMLDELSGVGSSSIVDDNFYISGTRKLEQNLEIKILASVSINFYSWNNDDPSIIISNNDLYFHLYSPNTVFNNLIIQANLSSTSNNSFDDGTQTGDNGVLTFNNCFLKYGTKIRFKQFDNLILKNSLIICNGILEAAGSYLMGVDVDNCIFDVADFDARPINQINPLSVDNCAFTSATSSFVTTTVTWTNIHQNWPRPSIFSTDVSALNLTADLNYLNSNFVNISAIGNTSFVTTWLSGRRDGIGSLYFPEISAFSVSASGTTGSLDSSIPFVLSGLSNPFIEFSASSATYNFDDGNISAVNQNSVINHSFSTNASFVVGADIRSYNGWYTKQAQSFTILIGSFGVVITIYDSDGNDVTNGETKPIKDLTFSATVNGLNASAYNWDFGDSSFGTTNPVVKYYFLEGTKNVTLSAYTQGNNSATDTATILVSAISAEYFVDINSSYDVCASNLGTSVDPFNWNEFKGRLETSGEYLDTYRLSGSRNLVSNVITRNVLNIDRRKNFTITDWDVSAYGPWLLSIEDYTVNDSNSILSAAGCILRNGIIYNKPWNSPGYGGQITIGTTYNMFIVYSGINSHIIIDPFTNYFSEVSGVVTSAFSSINGSTIYLSGSEWKDNFSSATFSAVNQQRYNLIITDSVLVNLTRETNSDFSGCDIKLSHCVFNLSKTSMDSEFISIKRLACQSNWNPPSNFPFRYGNDLFNQNITYINNNKTKLKPFSGINTPPNPGQNYNTYEGYETGLFGYLRKDYVTSASI